MLTVRRQGMGLCVFSVSATNHQPLGTTICELPPPPRQQHIYVLANVPLGSQQVLLLYFDVFRSFRTSLWQVAPPMVQGMDHSEALA